MLLANYLVAQHLVMKQPDAGVLRCHPKPKKDKLDKFLEYCRVNGIGDLRADSAAQLQQSIHQLREKDPILDACLQVLASEPMQEAQYFRCGKEPSPDSWRHYALNIPYYTHFTSPIRRYADVLVHRGLTLALDMNVSDAKERKMTEAEKLEKEFLYLGYRREEIENCTEHCNEKKTSSKMAQEESDKLFFAVWLREQEKKGTPLETMGVVLGMGKSFFRILMPQFGHNEQVTWTDIQPAAELLKFTAPEAQRALVKLSRKGNSSKKAGQNIANQINVEKSKADNCKEEDADTEKSVLELGVLSRLRVRLTARPVETRLKIRVSILGLWEEDLTVEQLSL
eukprot:g4081.t1